MKRLDDHENMKATAPQVLSGIVERNVTLSGFNFNEPSLRYASGFPTPFKLPDGCYTSNSQISRKRLKKKSLFASQFQKQKFNAADQKQQQKERTSYPKDIVCDDEVYEKVIPTTLPGVTSDIHQENQNKIGNMSDNEISAEVQELESRLSPEIIEFLRNRRTLGSQASPRVGCETNVSVNEISNKQSIEHQDVTAYSDTDSKTNKKK